MTFASGSHLLGDLGVPGISDDSESLLAAIGRERGLPEDTHGALGAGDATFHAGWTRHRAGCQGQAGTATGDHRHLFRPTAPG